LCILLTWLCLCGSHCCWCLLLLVWYVLQEVESHPFDVDTMLFMDWRDDHLADLPEVKERNSKLPTFLYAMPFTKNKVMQATQLNCTASSMSRSNSELGQPREQ
jgi:hypothetical protein